MQTLLPYTNYKASAQALDNRRLRKQTWECKQVLFAILGRSTGWRNHCITRMWQDYPYSLYLYWQAMSEECKRRDLNGHAAPLIGDYEYILINYGDASPAFVSDARITSAYRSHLLAKDFDHYSQFCWTEQPKSGYYAPNKNGEWVMYSGGDDTGKKLN